MKTGGGKRSIQKLWNSWRAQSPKRPYSVISTPKTKFNPVWCAAVSVRGCTFAEQTASRPRLNSSHISRNTLRPDWKRVTCQIVFARERFDTYIYGLDSVNIESDHKPLHAIVLKPLNSAPQRLQRMLLRLQRYSLQIKCKNGKEMFLANTLSKAYLLEVSTCEFIHDFPSVVRGGIKSSMQERTTPCFRNCV